MTLPAWINRKILYTVLFLEGLLVAIFLTAGPGAEGWEGIVIIVPNMPTSIALFGALDALERILDFHASNEVAYLMLALALALGTIQWVLIFHIPVFFVRFLRRTLQESGIAAAMKEPATLTSFQKGSAPELKQKSDTSPRRT